MKKIKSALISVYYKDGLERIVRKLAEDGVAIYSTGGTLSFIESLGLKATSVESLTGYPSILGGRVKTLHPKVFGGILSRRDNPQDAEQSQQNAAEFAQPAQYAQDGAQVNLGRSTFKRVKGGFEVIKIIIKISISIVVYNIFYIFAALI